MQIEFRQRIFARDNAPNAGQILKQRRQGPLALEHDLSTTLRHQGCVTGKLNAVAHALLGMQQNGAAVERVAVPGRLVKFTR